jgi:anti-anti-sigma factor
MGRWWNMEIDEEIHGDVTILMVSGRIDAAAARELEAQLKDAIAEGAAKLLLDLGEVSYISSPGLRALLIAAKAAKAAGSLYALCALRPEVREIFDMSGFDRIRILPDRETALTEL